MVVSIMKHDPVDGWRFLQVPGILFLPQSFTIIDYDFYTYEYLMILAKDLDAVYIVKVCINEWKWNEKNIDMNNIQQGDILHSFDLSSKPEHFIVNDITQSITVYSSRDISIFCL